MTSDSWQAFLAHAAHARSKPGFDIEERAPRLTIAGQLRGALDALAAGDGSFERALDAALSNPRLTDQLYKLATRPRVEWLRHWARAGDPELKRALLAYASGTDGPVERFAAFARAAAEAQAAGIVEPQAGAVLAVGALLNFAVEPEALPIVNPVVFRQLREARGWRGTGASGVVERYADSLALMDDVRSELERSGIPVRDQLDVQSLVFIAVLESSHYSPEAVADRAARRGRAPAAARDGDRPYLSVCSCLGPDAAEDLPEWIEFHRLVGVERFFLYNNADRAEHRRVLGRYVDEGLVVLHDWPEFPPLVSAFNHCLETHRRDSRWIAFFDTDEFLFSPTGRKLPELLARYEQWPGIAVNTVAYTGAGHKTRPSGLVIENYLERASDDPPNCAVKSIVDPERTPNCKGPHHFAHSAGMAVDENCFPAQGPRTKSASFALLRLNHYRVRSEEEYRQKLETRDPSTGRPRLAGPRAHWLDSHPTERDEAILIYRSALERALEP